MGLLRAFLDGFSRTVGIFPLRRKTLTVDERVAAVHARLGLRDVSRTIGEDGIPVIKLERINAEGS